MKNYLLLVVASTFILIANPCHAIKQGGDAIVSYKEDVVTLDPAIGYDWQNWSIIKSLNARLMTYEAGTAKLITDLASEFAVSKDGMTYTFTLRKGVKFTNWKRGQG